VCKFADMSIIAFSKIIAAVHTSSMLATSYRGHPSLQLRLGSNYRVCLNIGLHAGWAVEGAVGSEFKIDASYISPHVAIAGNIETATNLYGVSLVASETVVNLCSSGMAAKCRLIDRVHIPGSHVPLELYSIDLDFLTLPVDTTPPLDIVWNARERFKVRQFLDAEKKEKLAGDFDLMALFDRDKSIARMRQKYTQQFLQVFKMGYENYSEGEWQVAQGFLNRTLKMLGTIDGPSGALLKFMQRFDFSAPKDWHGFHGIEDLYGSGTDPPE